MAQRAMVGSPAATRRMFLFCLPLLVIIPESRQAVPWREKNVVKIATTLPSRLIDSIMAKGNWNLLFQEGPFAEFQRQIAIANHFTARGDQRQAGFYFDRAERALEIAYGTLRGKFGWPRSHADLKAQGLPAGENRETFEDFVLCQLQLSIERAMAFIGQIPASIVSKAEKQLGMTISDRDADLDQLIRFVTEAVAIRKSRGDAALLADKFAELSDKSPLSVRNYWSRRLTLFRILENIHHGNLGRAYQLVRFLENKQKSQWDPLHLARLYVQTGAMDEAEKILTDAMADPENRSAENFAEQVRLSSLRQGILLWQKRYAEASQTAAATEAFLLSFSDSSQVNREDILYLRQATRNENLRVKIYNYLNDKTCPDVSAYQPNTDMEIEWQVRERLFHETCKAKTDTAFWRGLVRDKKTTQEIHTIASYHLAREKNPLEFAMPRSPLATHLQARAELPAAMRRGKENLTDLTIRYLRGVETIDRDLVFADWGLDISDDLAGPALARLPRFLSEKKAAELFTALHHRLILIRLRSDLRQIHLLPAGDAASMSQRLGSVLLDIPVTPRYETAALHPGFSGKILWYADEEIQLVYDPGNTARHLRVLKLQDNPGLRPDQGTVLMGAAMARAASLHGTFYLPPSLAYCHDCRAAADKTGFRLTIYAPAKANGTELRSELADNFAFTVTEAGDETCAARTYEDSVIIAATGTTPFPCDTRIDKWIVSAEVAGRVPAFLLAAGWRRGVSMIVVPEGLTPAARTSFLFDFFQRTNRRQVKPDIAFKEAKARAEKSFPSEAAMQGMSYYESLP